MDLNEKKRYDDFMEEVRRQKLKLFKRIYKKNGQEMVDFCKPGSVVTMNDGKRYRVADDGSLRRIKVPTYQDSTGDG